MTDPDASFDSLLAAALAQPIDGWHFSFLAGRVQREALPWDYAQLALDALEATARVVDLDTGGGEFLTSLLPPVGTVAIEDWVPNVPVARAALEPLGVRVLSREEGRIPLPDADRDLVLNRHGDLDLPDIARVLAPGGTLLTQQVGHDNESEFAEWFGTPATDYPNAARGVADLQGRTRDAGLVADVVAHGVTSTRYLDVGAVVMQLRAVPWQVPGFDAVRDREVLLRIHEHISREGAFVVHSTRYLLRAHKP